MWTVKLREPKVHRHLVEVDDPDTDVWHPIGAATHGNKKIQGYRVNPLSPLNDIVND